MSTRHGTLVDWSRIWLSDATAGANSDSLICQFSEKLLDPKPSTRTSGEVARASAAPPEASTVENFSPQWVA